MKRTEAIELYDKQITAKQLVDLSDSVISQVLYVLDCYYPQGITKNVVDLLYRNHETKLFDEENYNILADKIFEAIQASFTLPQIKILNKSNDDSGNYYLMYNKLHKYFKEKIEESGNTIMPILLTMDDDLVYETLFREMINLTPEPRVRDQKKWRTVTKGREIDYTKIQEIFTE